MNILGLNIFHPDSAACLIIDGKIVAAVEEERFTRIKHYVGFPFHSINFCLNFSKLSMRNIDYIAVNFNYKYNLKEKFLFTIKNNFLFTIYKFFIGKKKNSLKKILNENFFDNFNKKIEFVPHHLAHVSSSFLASGFKEAIGISFDGSGDFSTFETYSCNKKDIKLLNKICFPHSLGIFYQAFTQFLGFKKYGDEYKVMGLAAYGKPIYTEKIFKNIISYDDKSFYLNLEYFIHHKKEFNFNFENGIPTYYDLFSNKISNLFGKPRQIKDQIEQFHMDLAASVQEVFETVILSILINLAKKNMQTNLVISGGCAFNSVLNGKIEKLKLFKDIYISSNVGDAGGAVGAGLYTSKKYYKDFSNVKINHTFFGTEYSNSYIKNNIVEKNNMNILKLNFKFIEDESKLIDITTDYLREKKIVGWFQDKMEFGPRSLGNRSIIADPTDTLVRDKINLMIKNRENFRPFAPAILSEFVKDYLETENNSYFMSFVADAKKKSIIDIPGVVHINNTCRFQSVDDKSNYKFYKLIKSFYSKTGIPVILNTSLNMNEPICENPEQAFDLFIKSSLDCLVLQNWIFLK
jgi:carbamoyltransferase